MIIKFKFFLFVDFVLFGELSLDTDGEDGLLCPEVYPELFPELIGDVLLGENLGTSSEELLLLRSCLVSSIFLGFLFILTNGVECSVWDRSLTFAGEVLLEMGELPGDPLMLYLDFVIFGESSGSLPSFDVFLRTLFGDNLGIELGVSWKVIFDSGEFLTTQKLPDFFLVL